MLSAAVLCSILIAGEAVHFDAKLQPQFTAKQIAGSSDAVRAGLARVAATGHGRILIEALERADVEVDVIEDPGENAIGRAPQPGIATLTAAADRSRTKAYELILNPAFFSVPQGMEALPGQPASAADAMALAWGGEMLHIYFYAQGISLPHHPRSDFQDDWFDLAAELGMPTATHDDGDERGSWRRRPVIRIIGRR